METLLEMSRSLSRTIANDEYPLEDIEALLLERDARIRSLLSQPLDPSLRTAITAWIHEVQAVDEEALNHLQSRRQRMCASLSRMRHEMQVMSHYEDIHSLGDD